MSSLKRVALSLVQGPKTEIWALSYPIHSNQAQFILVPSSSNATLSSDPHYWCFDVWSPYFQSYLMILYFYSQFWWQHVTSELSPISHPHHQPITKASDFTSQISLNLECLQTQCMPLLRSRSPLIRWEDYSGLAVCLHSHPSGQSVNSLTQLTGCSLSRLSPPASPLSTDNLHAGPSHRLLSCLKHSYISPCG